MPRLEGKDNSGARWAIGLGLVVILGGLAYLALGGPRAGSETIDTNIARPMPPRRPDALADGSPASNAANTVTGGGAAASGTPGGPASPNGSVTGTDPATQSNAANPTGSTAGSPADPANPAANPTPLVGETPQVNPDAPNGSAQNGVVPNGVVPNGVVPNRATPSPGTMGGASMQNVPPPPGVTTGSGATSPGAP